MKHIKIYESFKSYLLSNNFEQDIEDILLEITDIGYYALNGEMTKGFYIIIKKRQFCWINYNEIKDCVLRLKDYLGDRFIGCDVRKGIDNVVTKFELTEDNDPGTYISQLVIYYT